MWFWWLSYSKIRKIDAEIAEIREQLKVLYARLRDLVALRKYHQDAIDCIQVIMNSIKR